MKKVNISILLLLFTVYTVYSQSNFEEGFIVTNKNDTLVGLIDFRTDYENSLKCDFKLNELDSTKSFYPGDIASFCYLQPGKRYESKNVVINNKPQTYFLEYLVQGMISLYYLGQENGYYIFEKEDGTMISLTKKPDELILNKYKEDNIYKGKLGYVFKDYFALAQQSVDAAFDRKTMIGFTKLYHEKMCKPGDNCIVFESDYRKKYVEHAVTLFSGIEYNVLNLRAEYFSNLYSSSPIIGAEVEFSDPRFSRAMGLVLSVNVSKMAGACDYGTENKYYYNYNYSALKSTFNVGAKYKYVNGPFQPYLEVDFSQRFLMNMKSTFRKDQFYYAGQISSTYRENEILPETFIYGLSGGAGFDIPVKENKYIAVKLMYERDIKYKTYNKYTNVQLRIGYKF